MTASRSTGAAAGLCPRSRCGPVSGHGSWLMDEEGERWLDAYGGHAVASTGSLASRRGQGDRRPGRDTDLLLHRGSPRGRGSAGRRLVARSAPIRWARSSSATPARRRTRTRWRWPAQVTGRQRIVSMAGGWHGRTAATLACTDGAKYEAGAPGAGYPALAQGARSTTSPPSRPRWTTRWRRCSGAGPGDGRCPGLLAASSSGPPAGSAIARRGADLRRNAVRRRPVRRLHGGGGVRRGARRPSTMAKGLAAGLPIGAVVATPAMTAGLKVGDLAAPSAAARCRCGAAWPTSR